MHREYAHNSKKKVKREKENIFIFYVVGKCNLEINFRTFKSLDPMPQSLHFAKWHSPWLLLLCAAVICQHYERYKMQK